MSFLPPKLGADKRFLPEEANQKHTAPAFGGRNVPDIWNVYML